MTSLECAWAAGFFEGEGSVSVGSTGAGRTVTRIHVEVAQVDRSPLEWLAARWGGNVYDCQPKSHRGRPFHRWVLNVPATKVFLADIRPFVVRERVQQRIDIALACLAAKTNTHQNRTPEYRALHHGFVAQLRALNARGTPLEQAVLRGRL